MRRLMPYSTFLAIGFLAAACAKETMRGGGDGIAAQDARIDALRTAIRAERARLDSFPNDTAARRREAHLVEEAARAEKERLEMVRPPLDAAEKASAQKSQLRHESESERGYK